MAKDTSTLTVANYSQLLDFIGESTEEALESNSRTDMREWLETLSDLCDSDSELVFNEDGSVEVATEDEIESSDEDEGE